MIVIPTASTLNIGHHEIYFKVTGTTPITTISTRPADSIITIECADRFGKFISSANLLMDDGVDYWWDAGDIITFISDGTCWKELNRNEASYIVDGRYAYKTDTFSTSSSDWTDVPGLSLIFKPRSANSLVKLTANLSCSTSYVILHARIVKDGNPIKVGDAASTRTCGHGGIFTQFQQSEIGNLTLVVFDEPDDDNVVTYKVQIRANVSGNNVHINRTDGDLDATSALRSTSSFEVTEIRGYLGSLGNGNPNYVPE